MKAHFHSLIICILSILCSCDSNKGFNENEIHTILDVNAQKLLEETHAFAASISMTKDGKTTTKHYGEIDKGKGNLITDTTLFEIASVTKVFTGTLMAQAVLEKKVKLDEDIRVYLPEDYPNLEFDDQPITIKDLLGFRSGINQTFPDVSQLRIIENDSTAFQLSEFGSNYNKSRFFEDLRNVKLDTYPGTTHFYNELCPELTGYILERVYQKDYRKIVEDRLLGPLKMDNTFFTLPYSEKLLNGYNMNEVLMPNFSYAIWGAGGMLKSSIRDLNKFLRYHLQVNHQVVVEARRNIRSSQGNWNGYLWDNISVTRNGIQCAKHGGAYGVQNMFVVYPEQNMGILMVINQSAPNTHENLQNAVTSIATDVLDSEYKHEEKYGYTLEGENVIFQYAHPEKMDTRYIENISVAGSFNNWNPGDILFQMKSQGKGIYRLSVPISIFNEDTLHEFRFVINGNSWLSIPKGIPNRTKAKRYDNIILDLEEHPGT